MILGEAGQKKILPSSELLWMPVILKAIMKHSEMFTEFQKSPTELLHLSATARCEILWWHVSARRVWKVSLRHHWCLGREESWGRCSPSRWFIDTWSWIYYFSVTSLISILYPDWTLVETYFHTMLLQSVKHLQNPLTLIELEDTQRPLQLALKFAFCYMINLSAHT